MFIDYKEWKPQYEARTIVRQANDIIEQYEEQGYTLSLRQLYYQFVANGLFGNTNQNYNKLKSIMTKGRLAGYVSWKAIEDRTRIIKEAAVCEDETDLMKRMINTIRFDRWTKQGFHIEVWVEKEALGDVIKGPCEALGVHHMACKGYMSSSSLWRAGRRFKKAREQGLECILIHLGDHDPSGLDMTRDNRERAQLFAHDSAIEVRRIALNMDQIEEHQPPPNPAKETDSRATPYIKEFGKYSWELDALEPALIEQLITDEIEPLRDYGIDDEITAEEDELRDLMTSLHTNWPAIRKMLEAYDDFTDGLNTQ